MFCISCVCLRSSVLLEFCELCRLNLDINKLNVTKICPIMFGMKIWLCVYLLEVNRIDSDMVLVNVQYY